MPSQQSLIGEHARPNRSRGGSGPVVAAAHSSWAVDLPAPTALVLKYTLLLLVK
jgi:hypothetical protein